MATFLQTRKPPATVYVRFLVNALRVGLDQNETVRSLKTASFAKNTGYVMPVNVALHRVGDTYQRLAVYYDPLAISPKIAPGSPAPEQGVLFAFNPATSIDYLEIEDTPVVIDLLMKRDTEGKLELYRHQVDAEERKKWADVVCHNPFPAFQAAAPTPSAQEDFDGAHVEEGDVDAYCRSLQDNSWECSESDKCRWITGTTFVPPRCVPVTQLFDAKWGYRKRAPRRRGLV